MGFKPARARIVLSADTGSRRPAHRPGGIPVETLFNSPEKYQKHDETIDGYRTHFIEAGDPANDRLLLVRG